MKGVHKCLSTLMERDVVAPCPDGYREPPPGCEVWGCGGVFTLKTEEPTAHGFQQDWSISTVV